MLRRLLLVLLTLVGVGTVTGGGVASAEVSPEQTLADKYVPVMMVRTEPAPCSKVGEPYRPISVDAVLDNDQIALRMVGNGDPVVKWGPTAADLTNRGEGFYLDFPGSALAPGCIYEHDGERFSAGLPATVHAHIATEADRPGYLVVQYWLYWYYNGWNNVHESDWEFIQVVFKAHNVAEALKTEPIEVGYAQHEGGERAAWDDPKLQRDGDHPIIYSSQRSHASYYQSAVFMGRGASEGFGCDNTTGPSTRVEPIADLIPDGEIPADDPFAWVNFQGHWGELHGAPNNGPTGPSTKPRWTAPMTWQDGLRNRSVVVPSSGAVGAGLVDNFCSTVTWGSAQFVSFVAQPAKLIVISIALLAAVIWLTKRTSWRRVAPLPLVQRRRFGELVTATIGLIRRRPGFTLSLGLLALPVIVVGNVVGAALSSLLHLNDYVSQQTVSNGAAATNGGAGFQAFISSLASSLAFMVVMAAISSLLADGSPDDWTLRKAVRVLNGHVKALSWTFLQMALIIVALIFTLVGIPIAAWLSVRWQFVPSVITVDGLSGRAARRASVRLVRGRWLHTALISALILAIVNGTGLVIGLVLLTAVQGLTLGLLALIVGVINIIMIPIGAIAMSLLYGDAVAESSESSSADSDDETDALSGDASEKDASSPEVASV